LIHWNRIDHASCDAQNLVLQAWAGKMNLAMRTDEPIHMDSMIHDFAPRAFSILIYMVAVDGREFSI